MAYIGNGPGVASQRITTSLTATSNQTTFTPTSGYTVGYVDVYLNGVRLVNGTDYTASNGTTVVLASGAAENDVLEVVAYLPRGLSDGYTKAEADARYLGIDAETLPDQDGQSGKYLTTDGTDASWATINTNPTPADVSDQANTSTGYFDLPAGTTAQRPASPASGMVRFNTSIGEPEWYDPDGSQWLKFSQGAQYTVQYLIVAGGGSGGSGIVDTGQGAGGGGGAGGYLTGSSSVFPNAEYPIVVGLGGATYGASGGNSSALTLTSIGGGAGGNPNSGNGSSGGSGGGGASNAGPEPVTNGSGGSGTSGQGFAGGSGYSDGNRPAGGGGGASEAGTSGSVSNGLGHGGDGLQWLDGNFYAGGGGGGVSGSGAPTGGSGGDGGGGTGCGDGANNATAGSANTGGGGGGGTDNGVATGKAGGSGIVIVRYVGSQRGTGGTVTSSGGYTYHTFTSSGTFTA